MGDGVRRLVEFDDYSHYYGKRLYPQVGRLAWIGVGFVAAFGLLDLALVGFDRRLAILLGDRLAACLLLGAAAWNMLRSDHGYGPARVTLALGGAAFFALAFSYLFVVSHAELVAFTLVFFLFGVMSLAALISLRDYAVDSLLSLALTLAVMAALGTPTSTILLALLYAVPLQLFLGAAIAAVRRGSREQYETVRQNFFLSTLDTLSSLLNRRSWYDQSAAGIERRRPQDGTIGILLPEGGADGARETAERIRRAIESSVWDFEGRPLRVTVSVGCAASPASICELEALVKRGDACLYRAKEGGRNRVEAEAAEG